MAVAATGAVAGYGLYIITSAAINAVVGAVNGSRSRSAQSKMAQQSAELTRELEHNRQDFQLSMNERNVQTQRELARLSHDLRLEEQRTNFEATLRTAEWNRFLANWPLVTSPNVIREQQLLSDGTVCLRIIFAKSSNNLFNQYVYPIVEQRLKEFAQKYRNDFDSKNLIYYHNAYLHAQHGGAMIENIHYALRELPTAILDANVVDDVVYVSLYLWGLGSREKTDITLFKIPFDIRAVNTLEDKRYYTEFAYTLAKYVKLIMGYAYDAYNLIQYDRMPLLPQIALNELEMGDEPAAILSVPEMQSQLMGMYYQLYTVALGSDNFPGHAPTDSERYNVAEMHVLKLKYAKTMQKTGYMKDMNMILYSSIGAWSALRSDDAPDLLLSGLADRSDDRRKYISRDDAQYLMEFADVTDSSDCDERLSVLSRYARSAADAWLSEHMEESDGKASLEVKNQANTVSRRRIYDL